MFSPHLLLVIGVAVSVASPMQPTTPSTQTTAAALQPVYQGQDQMAGGYIPHATYPYADAYGPAYEGYLIPNAGSQYSAPYSGYTSSIVPTAQSALQVTLKILAKVGLFLLGGVVFLTIGGLLTTVICSLTPICTISFNGFDAFNREAMRAYVTPERVASAAAFVEDAVQKYQRLQRAVHA